MCDGPEAYLHQWRTARKEHTCYECRGIIFKGEKYHKHSGIWGGEPQDFKLCGECEYLRFDLSTQVFYPDNEEIYFGGLSEAVFESKNPEIIGRFLDNKERRKAHIKQWMLDLLDDLLNKEDDKADEEKNLDTED